MKRIACLFLLVWALVFCPARAEQAPGALLGQPLEDFRVTTAQGDPFVLSEALAEKDAALICFWATWAEPCADEFACLQEVWEARGDRAAILALSIEPEDDDAALNAFAAAHGATFPIAGEGGLCLGARYAAEGVPALLVVDRFGRAVYQEVGSHPSADEVLRVLDFYLDPGYAETVVLTEAPPARPVAPETDADALDRALNAAGGRIAFYGGADASVWPMLPAQKDGRDAAVNANAGKEGDRAAVYARVAAGEGDVLAFDIACSTSPIVNALTVYIDNNAAKSFSGERPFTSWALPLEPGEHEIAFVYTRSDDPGDSADSVWLDEVRLLSGDAAEAALAGLPEVPRGEAFELRVRGESAREIAFDGPEDFLRTRFAAERAWIVPEGRATVEIVIDGDVDPDEAFVSGFCDRGLLPLSELLQDGAYVCTGGIDSLEETGSACSVVTACAGLARPDETRAVLLFAGEAEVLAFVRDMADYEGVELAWHFADSAAADGGCAIAFVDESGAPVPGCVVRFGPRGGAVVVTSDANGVAAYAGEPRKSAPQLLSLPAGYALSGDPALRFGPEGGTITVVLEKK